MTLEEVVEFIKRMDINYNTNYNQNVDYINEWYKDLQFYDAIDVNKSFDKYLKSNFSNIYPKRWAILNNIHTKKQKEQTNGISIVCPFCLRKVKALDYDEHYTRCMHIDFIGKYVKKYTGKDIDYNKYINYTDEEIQKRFDKIAKMIMEKEPNTKVAECLKNYFKNQENIL